MVYQQFDMNKKNEQITNIIKKKEKRREKKVAEKNKDEYEDSHHHNFFFFLVVSFEIKNACVHTHIYARYNKHMERAGKQTGEGRVPI